MSLKDKVIFISGGSRGIGLAMVKKAAKDGAKVVIAAKTADPHPKLPGTIYTAADEIVEAGGEALPMICDIRNEDNVRDVVNNAVDHFGGIDICINNASAIQLTNVTDTEMKRYDLMHNINTRGTFLVSKIHRYDHPGFIMIGKCLVFTEKEGKQLCEAPRMMLTSAGTQRVICVLEDTVWCTVHRTNAQTAEEAEKFLTAPDYEDRVLTQNQSKKLEALLCQ